MKKMAGVLVLCFFFASASFAFAETYTYDKANRLIFVQYDDGSSIRYAYDQSGNLEKIIKQTAKGRQKTYLIPAEES